MNQHIDFLPLLADPPRARPDFRDLVAVVATIMIGTTALTGLDVYSAYQLAKDNQRLAATLEQQKQRVSEARRTLTPADDQGDPAAVQAQIEQRLGEYRRALERLEALQNTRDERASGFSRQLEALAALHVPGTQLTTVALHEGGDSVRLTGIAARADKVPSYVARLDGSADFAPLAFRQLTIEPVGSGAELAFVVEGTAAEATP